MLVRLHKNRNAQIVLGLLFGIAFGFLLQKGGVTNYNVITGQLLLTDFTVLKLMLSAVIVGMIVFHLLKHVGYVQSHAAGGSFGSNVIGGLIFGVGFCPAWLLPGNCCRSGRDRRTRCTRRRDDRSGDRGRFFCGTLSSTQEACTRVGAVSCCYRPGFPEAEPVDRDHPYGSIHDRGTGTARISWFVKIRKLTILFLRAVLTREFHSFLDERERLYRTSGGTFTMFK